MIKTPLIPRLQAFINRGINDCWLSQDEKRRLLAALLRFEDENQRISDRLAKKDQAA